MTEITLAQLLQSREERAAFQKTLTDSYRLPLVSFTVNMPGAVKDCPQGRIIFEAGAQAIREGLAGRLVYVKEKHLVTGWEGFYVCHWEALSLKQAMCRMETEHPLGRLFDMDVLDSQGRHLSRGELGLSKRLCLICDGDGDACTRSRAHPLPQLRQQIDSMVAAWQAIDQEVL